MKTTGQILKDRLKLKNFSSVKIRRLVTGGSLRTYQIVYDSRRPTFPITVGTLRNNILVPKVVNGDAETFFGTPWANIENFNGFLEPALFFVTDLSGLYGRKNNYSENKPTVHMQCTLREYVTLAAYKDKNLVSPITQTYKDIRYNTKQIKRNGTLVKTTANVSTKLLATELEGNDVVFKFLTEATEMYPENHKFKQVDPQTKRMEDNPSKTYELWIKLLDIVGEGGWLSVFNQQKEKISQKDIKDILAVSNVQFWSNSPSWQYQGFNWWNAQLDASIFPENTPAPTSGPRGWKNRHGDGSFFLDKHISQLVDSLPFFVPQMASSLTNLLRKKGLLVNGKIN